MKYLLWSNIWYENVPPPSACEMDVNGLCSKVGMRVPSACSRPASLMSVQLVCEHADPVNALSKDETPNNFFDHKCLKGF